jgi:hypothetical protein
VDTTGSSAGYDAQPGTTTPEDWTQHSLVQVEGGFIAGLALGRVPFGSVVAGAIAGPGSRWAEIGRGVGEIVGGGFAFAAGMAGMLGGGAASGTGVLTLPGVAAVVGSAALVAGGIANVKAGAERLGQALSMSSGSGSSGPQGALPLQEEQRCAPTVDLVGVITFQRKRPLRGRRATIPTQRSPSRTLSWRGLV